MTARCTVFASFRKREPADPSPDALTSDERLHIEDRLGSGVSPRFGIIRKLLRLCDQRRDIALEQQALIEKALAILTDPRNGAYVTIQRAAKALTGGNDA